MLASLWHTSQAIALIGQTRLATSGSFHDSNNNQPLVQEQIALAHNGTVRNWLALARQYDLTLQTQCDSEVILALYQRRALRAPKESAALHLRWVLAQLESTAPLALFLLTPRAFLVVRRAGSTRPAHPLYRHDTGASGVLFCSWPLTSEAHLLRDDAILVYRLDAEQQTSVAVKSVAISTQERAS